jgi:hypothetical protein
MFTFGRQSHLVKSEMYTAIAKDMASIRTKIKRIR